MMDFMVQARDLHNALGVSAGWTGEQAPLDHVYLIPDDDPDMVRVVGSDNIRLMQSLMPVSDRSDVAQPLGIHRLDVLPLLTLLARYDTGGVSTWVSFTADSERWAVTGALNRIEGLIRPEMPPFHLAQREVASTDSHVMLNPALLHPDLKVFGERINLYVGSSTESIIILGEHIRGWVMPLRQ